MVFHKFTDFGDGTRTTHTHACLLVIARLITRVRKSNSIIKISEHRETNSNMLIFDGIYKLYVEFRLMLKNIRIGVIGQCRKHIILHVEPSLVAHSNNNYGLEMYDHTLSSLI